jgi:hypothetical protein
MIQNETCMIGYQFKGEPVQERYYHPEAVAWEKFYELCKNKNINYVQIVRLTVKHLKYYSPPPPEPINFEI